MRLPCCYFFQIGPCTIIMYFEASDATLVARLLQRGATSGRQDDNEETIQKRLNTFHTHNDPIINHFKSKLKKVNFLSPMTHNRPFRGSLKILILATSINLISLFKIVTICKLVTLDCLSGLSFTI